MPYDPSPVSLLPPAERDGQLVLSWTSTAPAGTWYQIYIGRSLAGWTRGLRFEVAAPTEKVRIDVGAVEPGERTADLSGSIPAGPAERAALAWFGGSYLDPTGGDDVAGFRVYGAATPGGPIDHARPLADLVAYPGGTPVDGWGRGRWGRGGWGRASSEYAWTSGILGTGVWTFGVRPYDAAGNEGAAITTSVVVAGPPTPPPLDPATRKRVWYDYDPTTRVATLHWLAASD